MAVITVSQAKTLLPNVSGSAMDALIEDAIEQADATLAQYLGWPPPSATAPPTLASTAYTFYSHIGEAKIRRLSRDQLQLPVRPITAVASLYCDPLRAWDASTLVSTSDYLTIQDQGLLVRKSDAALSAFDGSFAALKVTCTAGFSNLETAAAGLYRALLALVRHFFDLRGRQGRAGASVGGSSEQLREEEMPKFVRQAVQTYRLRRAPYDPDFPRAWEKGGTE